MISVAKKTNLFVFHFFRRTDITPQLLHSVESYLKSIFSPVRNFHFAVGTPVCGIRKIYDSYSAAVIALQSTFFFEPGTCLNPERLSGLAGPELPEQAVRDLTAALERADRDEAAAVLSRLYACCRENPSLLERSVQSLYYQLFAIIADQSRKQQLPADSMPLMQEKILEYTESFFFYEDLHRSLTAMLEEFFRLLNSAGPENSAVYLIKSYIQRHYGNPMLSTKEISEYASLSASYACTIFKNETGQTLNQYLTEYRLNKARELLNDPRNTVSSVSTMVGYNDSNYFSKAFKKYTGISPTVYRERRIK